MQGTNFEEIISADWKKDEEEFGLILVETESGVNGAVGEFMIIWDERYPISHALSESDCEKMYRLLLNSNKMFQLLRGIDSAEAKELVKKIEGEK